MFRLARNGKTNFRGRRRFWVVTVVSPPPFFLQYLMKVPKGNGSRVESEFVVIFKIFTVAVFLFLALVGVRGLTLKALFPFITQRSTL